MRRIFKCASCRKELDFTEVNFLSGKTIHDYISGIRYDTSTNLCETCYKEQTASVDLNVANEQVRIKEWKNIGALRLGQKVDLVVTVIKKGNEQIVTKNGRTLRLCRFMVKDESGEIDLILWNTIIDLVKVGDLLQIKNGYVGTWNNKPQITLGNDGSLKRLDSSSAKEST